VTPPHQKSMYQIGQLEMSVSLIAMIIGTGIIVLPRLLASEMNTTDGWISILISSSIIVLLIFLIVRLQRYFPGQTLIQFLAEGAIGKIFSKLLALSFLVYFTGMTIYLCRFLTIVVDIYLLPETPNEVIVMLLLLISTYAISKGVQGIVHLNLMFTPFVLIVSLGILTFAIPEMEIQNLRPILAEGLSPIFKGLQETIFAFLGIEILFFFMAHMKKKDLRAKPFIITTIFITALYLIIYIMTISILDLHMTQKITFPFIELVKDVELPGELFERPDPFFVSIWLMTMFNTVSITHFISIKIITNEFLIKVKKKWITPLFAFLLYILIFLPKSLIELSSVAEWISFIGATNVILGLLFGYITVWQRSNNLADNSLEGDG